MTVFFALDPSLRWDDVLYFLTVGISRENLGNTKSLPKFRPMVCKSHFSALHSSCTICTTHRTVLENPRFSPRDWLQIKYQIYQTMRHASGGWHPVIIYCHYGINLSLIFCCIRYIFFSFICSISDRAFSTSLSCKYFLEMGCIAAAFKT